MIAVNCRLTVEILQIEGAVVVLIRLHHTHHIDAAYCYASHMFRGLCLSVLLDTPVKWRNISKCIWEQGPKIHVLDGSAHGATWWIWLNDTCVVAMWSYVNLHWLLVHYSYNTRHPGKDVRCIKWSHKNQSAVWHSGSVLLNKNPQNCS